MQYILFPETESLDTYWENLEDVDMGEVQFFIFAVHWKRHRYMTEVL